MQKTRFAITRAALGLALISVPVSSMMISGEAMAGSGTEPKAGIGTEPKAGSGTDAKAAAPTAPAIAPSPEAITIASKLLVPAEGWNVSKEEKVKFDDKVWSVETLGDGSEIYTQKSGGEHKRVILRDGPHLSSISAYKLNLETRALAAVEAKKEAAKGSSEEASSVVFHKGKLYSMTRCKDDGGKLGRTCLTATSRTCAFVNSPFKPNETVFPAALSQELKTLEVRAVATVLTLRGSDHQLENVARFGNRMGLKDPLQTTKGRLTSKDEKTRSAAVEEMKTLCKDAGLATASAPNTSTET